MITEGERLGVTEQARQPLSLHKFFLKPFGFSRILSLCLMSVSTIGFRAALRWEEGGVRGSGGRSTTLSAEQAGASF